MQITLSDGTSFELPHEGDVYRLNPGLCVDFPGLGMRPEDTHCIRCGKEVNLTNRQNPRGCNRSCFLCGINQHMERVSLLIALALTKLNFSRLAQNWLRL